MPPTGSAEPALYCSQYSFRHTRCRKLLRSIILDVIDVIEMQKAEIWGTFVLEVPLPSDRLGVWEVLTRHLTLMNATALIIDDD